jgi:thioredoxin-like negative regulator of GroEL
MSRSHKSDRSRARTATVLAALLVAAGVSGAATPAATPDPAAAQPLAWESSLPAAVKRAQDEGKPLLMDFTGEFCGWCRVMDRQVYGDPKAVERLRGFVCLKVDIQKDPRTALLFGAQSVPRAIVVNTHGQVVADQVGYVPLDRFLAWLDEATPWLTKPMPEAALAPGLETAVTLRQAAESAARAEPGPALPTHVLAYLSHPMPEVRAEAEKALLARGTAVVPALVAALDAEYLGVRIAAARLLAKLTADGPPFDPWASAGQRAKEKTNWTAWLAKRRESPAP